MRKLKKKSSKFRLKIENLLTKNPELGLDCMEALVELDEVINGIYNRNLDENILRLAYENPSNKKAQSIVKIMNNEEYKEKYNYDARVLYAKELVKQIKQMYGMDLTDDFEVIDRKFRWNKNIRDFLNDAKKDGVI